MGKYNGWLLSLIAVMMLIGLNSDPVTGHVDVVVNNEKIMFDTSPMVQDGRTLVPIRHIAESLDHQVEWDAEKEQVSICGNQGDAIELIVGEQEAFVNDESVIIDVPPLIQNGRTMVPLRFISENLNYNVLWQPKSNTVQITDEKHKTIPILMYHILLEGENNTVSVDPVRFEEHMKALTTSGFQTITDDDLAAYLYEDETLPANPILITFDDGYVSNYTKAFPVLQNKGMQASVNVIGSRMFEERTILEGEWEKFSWADARKMTGTISIQGHSYDAHVTKDLHHGKRRGILSGQLLHEPEGVSRNRIHQDVADSKRVIESALDQDVVAFAYPYGHFGNETVNGLKEAGYQLGYTVEPGHVRRGDDPYRLNRVTVNGDWSGPRLIEEIQRLK